MKIRNNPAWLRLAIALALACAATAQAFDHHEHEAAAPAAPAAELVVSAPVAALLARGVVVIPFQSDGVKIAPLYGEAAARVVPRLGHLHVTLDGASWHWVHADDGPIVLQGLSSGPHQLTLELADAAHRIITSRKVEFVVP